MDRTKGASLRRSFESSGFRLLVATTLFMCLTVLILLFENSLHNRFSNPAAMRSFQHSIGGLGTGASATPLWNLVHYDPRLQSIDDSNMWPIAGSYPYSPAAVNAVIAPGELQREDLKIIRIEQ